MNIKNFKIIAFLIAFALHCSAVKVYKDLNMSGNNITNVPTPIADNHAVNNEYIEKLVDELYECTNISVAASAKCAGGQISGYTPVPGEDLHSGMQHGVDWETNTRFTVDSTGSNVYDNLTGLIWTKEANIDGMKTWANAITYCENLVYGGRNDWRLPNVRELSSLADLSQESPWLPEGNPFVAVPATYWSSSTYAPNTTRAWRVSGYSTDNIFKTFTYYVWPVCGP